MVALSNSKNGYDSQLSPLREGLGSDVCQDSISSSLTEKEMTIVEYYDEDFSEIIPSFVIEFKCTLLLVAKR